MLKLSAHTHGGAVETVSLTETELSHVHVEFTPSYSDDDLEKLHLTGFLAAVDDIDVYFERRCTPENPFYIRWINDDGGYDYQMFENRYAIERAVNKMETFDPFTPDTEAADVTTETIDVVTAVTVKVGIEQATREQFEALSKLLFSPKIEWFNPKLSKWQRINLAGNQSNTWQTDTPAGIVEFKFELPKLNTQF